MYFITVAVGRRRVLICTGYESIVQIHRGEVLKTILEWTPCSHECEHGTHE